MGCEEGASLPSAEEFFRPDVTKHLRSDAVVCESGSAQSPIADSSPRTDQDRPCVGLGLLCQGREGQPSAEGVATEEGALPAKGPTEGMNPLGLGREAEAQGVGAGASPVTEEVGGGPVARNPGREGGPVDSTARESVQGQDLPWSASDAPARQSAREVVHHNGFKARLHAESLEGRSESASRAG